MFEEFLNWIMESFGGGNRGGSGHNSLVNSENNPSEPGKRKKFFSGLFKGAGEITGEIASEAPVELLIPDDKKQKPNKTFREKLSDLSQDIKEVPSRLGDASEGVKNSSVPTGKRTLQASAVIGGGALMVDGVRRTFTKSKQEGKSRIGRVLFGIGEIAGGVVLSATGITKLAEMKGPSR
jgi:hypothetical protein